MAHDLVIRGGTVVDGTGAPARRADVAVDGDRITAVGEVDAARRRPRDRRRRVASSRPGFVDLHSHLDAQVGWDPTMSSSCWHGVTSVVMGNCGMTFAPVRPGQARGAGHGDGVGRGHPRVLHPRRAPVGLGELRRLPRHDRLAAAGDQRRRLRRRRRGAPVRGRATPRASPTSWPPTSSCAAMAEQVDAAMRGRCVRLLDLTQPVPPGARRPQRAGHLVRPVGVLRASLRPCASSVGGCSRARPATTWRTAGSTGSTRSSAWMAEISRVLGRPFSFNLQQIRSLDDHYRRVIESGGRGERDRSAAAPADHPAQRRACCSASPPTRSSTTCRRSSRSRRWTWPGDWRRSATRRCGRGWSTRVADKPVGPFEIMYLMPADGAARYVYDEGDSIAGLARSAGRQPRRGLPRRHGRLRRSGDRQLARDERARGGHRGDGDLAGDDPRPGRCRCPRHPDHGRVPADLPPVALGAGPGRAAASRRASGGSPRTRRRSSATATGAWSPRGPSPT